MKMDAFTFGRKLLEANDLDPVYVLLWNTSWEVDEYGHSKLHDWLLAYWCFYHVGTASWIADTRSEEEYWTRFTTAASSKDYPRARERRHFRGNNALASVKYLRRRGVFDLFSELLSVGSKVEDVIDCVKGWVGFGPWISFKVADMLERLDIVNVEFTARVAMYEGSPMDGARLLWTIHSNDERHLKNVGEWAARKITDSLSDFEAPPRFDRPISFQEAETVLCKWKSYVGGHYTIGEDVHSCREGLLRFCRCKLAQTLLKSGKTGGLW